MSETKRAGQAGKMLGVRVRAPSWIMAVPAVMSLAGCASLYPVEPIFHPPPQFRGNVTVPVEFIDPGGIGARCAQRGAKFLGLPALNSLACSNVDLVTMPNPCLLTNAGWYAEALCHEIGHVNRWPASHPGGSYLRDEPRLKPARTNIAPPPG